MFSELRWHEKLYLIEDKLFRRHNGTAHEIAADCGTEWTPQITKFLDTLVLWGKAEVHEDLPAAPGKRIYFIEEHEYRDEDENE